MANKVYTQKQLELLQLWQCDKLKRINILSGSVRSGKTWISLVLWAFWVATMPKSGNYLMCAKTLTSLKRNCLDLLTELVGSTSFTYSIPSKQATLFGRKVHLEGASDARAEMKIRGMTLQGAYCDELTLFPEDFFNMLLSRLSVEKAKLFCTTNPDSMYHWLKVKFLDRENELALLHMTFLLDENTFLPMDYINELKKEYVGLYYQRFILGQWVAADGAIYDMWTDDNLFGDEINIKDIKVLSRHYISIDYGTTNPMVFLDIWDDGDTIWICKEYYYDSRAKLAQKTDAQYADDLISFFGSDEPDTIILDPSAASFKVELKTHGFLVKDADNDVSDGIRMTASMIKQRKIRVHKSCINFQKEIVSYAWDTKAAERGEEKPIKVNDHAADALRYFVKTMIKSWRLRKGE